MQAGAGRGTRQASQPRASSTGGPQSASALGPVQILGKARGEHGPERPAPIMQAGDPHHQGGTFWANPSLMRLGSTPAPGPSPARRGGAGDEQGAARQIDAGALPGRAAAGAPRAGARARATQERRGGQHADPDKPEGQQGDPGQGIYPRASLASMRGPGADGGEEGAQVEGDGDLRQHQQGAAARGGGAYAWGRGPVEGFGRDGARQLDEGRGRRARGQTGAA